MRDASRNDTDTTIYKVIIKVDEETDILDFSIWPAHRTNPTGWKDIKKTGTKQECIDYAVKARSRRKSA